MADVFISYSKHDRDVVAALATDLTGVGISVWWDRQLYEGQHFTTEIREQLDAARAVLVVWSDDSAASEYVIDEASRAKEANKLITMQVPGFSPTKIPLGFGQRLAGVVTDRKRIMRVLSTFNIGTSTTLPPPSHSDEACLDGTSWYRKGLLLFFDPKGEKLQALDYFRRAAELGDPDGMRMLADCLSDGVGGHTDEATATALYQKAIGVYRQRSDGKSLDTLASMYQFGSGVEEDSVEAARLARSAVDRGWIPAMSRLAQMYEDGEGVEQDEREALRLLKLGADNDDADCLISLGCRYEEADAIQEAVNCFRRAAELGDAFAHWWLGNASEHGEGLPQDYVAAAKHYQSAADAGSADGWRDLAYLHEEGRGVEQSDGLAKRYYREAIAIYKAEIENNSGDGGVFYKLGRLYEDGASVQVNDEEAARLYMQAIDKEDDPDAMVSLARMHEEGRGVTKSVKTARKLYERAAAEGDSEAKKGLRRLVKKKGHQ